MLGNLWNLPKIMFITHFNDKFDYLSGALAVLEGGGKFIQLRMKDASDEQVLDIAKTLRSSRLVRKFLIDNSEDKKPEKHIAYDENHKIKYIEYWNNNPEDPIKYEMKDSEKKDLEEMLFKN